MNTTTMRMKSIPFESTSREGGLLFSQVVTVRRILVTTTLLLVFSLLALGASTAHGSSSSAWLGSLEAGQNLAKRQNKPLLVMIARNGCHACAEMETNVSSPSARRALSGAVKVRLESSEYPDMTARYAAGGTPTTLVFGPAGGAPVYSYTGVMNRDTIVQLGRSLDSMR